MASSEPPARMKPLPYPSRDKLVFQFWLAKPDRAHIREVLMPLSVFGGDAVRNALITSKPREARTKDCFGFLLREFDGEDGLIAAWKTFVGETTWSNNAPAEIEEFRASAGSLASFEAFITFKMPQATMQVEHVQASGKRPRVGLVADDDEDGETRTVDELNADDAESSSPTLQQLAE
jgi:hypothetical protein